MNNLTYINHIINNINIITKSTNPVFLFGENIDTGSRIGGLARGLSSHENVLIKNVGNCELTHCGLGLGMLLDGGNSVLFVKQLDFLLLGLDQICNTYNFIRAYKPSNLLGSFTILSIVCDQGYQGPQSSLNSASDFHSLSNVSVFCLNSFSDISKVISSYFINPGFRIICLSQKLFNKPGLLLDSLWNSPDLSIFKYRNGENLTIINFNFSLFESQQISIRLEKDGVSSDLFHVNFCSYIDFVPLIESCKKTGKLLIIDDSKSINKFGDKLSSLLLVHNINIDLKICTREFLSDSSYDVNSDELIIDYNSILSFSIN